MPTLERLKAVGPPPPPPTAFSLSSVGMYEVDIKISKFYLSLKNLFLKDAKWCILLLFDIKSV